MYRFVVLFAVACICLVLAGSAGAQTFSCPAGTEDMLNYFVMNYPDRADYHMGPGNANPIYLARSRLDCSRISMAAMRITATAVIKRYSAWGWEPGYTTGSTTSTRTASGCSRRNRRSTTRTSGRRRPIFRAEYLSMIAATRLSPAVHVRLNMEAAADHPPAMGA